MDDAQKGQLVFSVESLAQGMQVEGYLDKLGVIPDYRNNRCLIVIDLVRLVSSLALKAKQSATELLLSLDNNKEIRHKKMDESQGSYCRKQLRPSRSKQVINSERKP